MTQRPAERPRVVFFSINGAGLGHLSRSLAYARRLRERADSFFFSLASAIDVIHDMGFPADYFVSEAWTRSESNAWERELLVRFGLLLEEVRPTVAVFDGTWPFQGFLDACDAYNVPRRVWSRRGLHRPGHGIVPVDERHFDLVIEPGELGTSLTVVRPRRPGRKVRTPPVTLLRDDELLDRDAARAALGLSSEGRHALLALGAGNLGDPTPAALGLIDELGRRGFDIACTRAPISIKDMPLPDNVRPLTLYPLARYLRAFDVFVGAAGYNTCCEVVQSGVPSLLVPNTVAADDQARRAAAVAKHARAVVSECLTTDERREAVDRLLALAAAAPPPRPALDGARHAADELFALCGAGAAA